MKRHIVFSLLLFFLFFPKSFAFADENGSTSATITPTPTVNYTLPYPGLLPDNPLYFLKIFRDRLIVFFISDHLKKSSFYLLQADKRLEAGWYLQKEGAKKDDLIFSTLSKSTNYLQQSADELKTARDGGEDTADMTGKLQTAVSKHQAVVAEMMTLASSSLRSNLREEQKRLTDLEKVVSGFSAK